MVTSCSHDECKTRSLNCVSGALCREHNYVGLAGDPEKHPENFDEEIITHIVHAPKNVGFEDIASLASPTARLAAGGERKKVSIKMKIDLHSQLIAHHNLQVPSRRSIENHERQRAIYSKANDCPQGCVAVLGNVSFAGRVYGNVTLQFLEERRITQYQHIVAPVGYMWLQEISCYVIIGGACDRIKSRVAR